MADELLWPWTALPRLIPHRRYDKIARWLGNETSNCLSLRFEFQMSGGVCRDLQESLRREDCPGRVYVPFGRERWPYFRRRLAERPADWWLLWKNMLMDRVS